MHAGRNASYISFQNIVWRTQHLQYPERAEASFRLIYSYLYKSINLIVDPKIKRKVAEYDSESDKLSNPKPEPKDTDEEVSDYEEEEEIEAPTVKKDKPNAKRVRSQALD
jgi:hypothetical protein